MAEQRTQKRTDFLAQRSDELHHGPATLVLADTSVIRAENILFEDGNRGRAVNISLNRRVPQECIWLRPIGTNKRGCRGKVTIKDGEDVLFIDDPDAVEAGDGRENPSLERDLAGSADVRALAAKDIGAAVIYGALNNGAWRHRNTGTVVEMGSRSAGATTACLQGEGNYLDWYMHANGGLIDEQVITLFAAVGWDLVEDDL